MDITTCNIRRCPAWHRSSYVYNNSDQRSRLTLADGSYWIYKYDQYGQVTSAHKYTSGNAPVPGQGFDYAFDSIGNRKAEKRNGNVFEYRANNLNQYSQRTVPGKVDITGSAEETAEVRIQKASDNLIFKPDRLGKYYSRGFALDNSANPAEETFNIFAVKYDPAQQKDIVAKLVERMFLPKTPEVFSHDQDGNLLSDGRFTYTWDGENRLVSLQSNTGILPVNRVKVDFSYDYMGRRVSKTVSTWVNNAWQVSKAEKYAWDGWNCIAKFNASNVLQESYLWGEDLSGSLQGAGGVGGLLAVTGSSGTYIPAYDGNGNIMAYLDSTGNKVAEYEYDAFGRTIVKAGVKADDFTFRFSTKWLGTETNYYFYNNGRPYIPEIGRWANRDPIGEFDSEGKFNLLYGFINNDPTNKWDYLGMEWTVERNGEDTAIARRTDLKKDIIQQLASDVNLGVRDFNIWARDENGKILDEDKIKKQCTFKIPNRVLLILPETGTGDYFKGGYGTFFRNRLQDLSNPYRKMGFKISIIDYDKESRRSALKTVETDWPTFGFILGRHGAKGTEGLEDRGKVLPRDDIIISPITFIRSPVYDYGLVFVNACFAGNQKWESLAAAGADVYISPPNYATTAWGIPDTKPPKK